MNPEMMLSQLAPLREPAPIGWWPLAPGWWGIAIILMVALAVLWIWVKKRRNRHFYRRLALAELASLRAQQASAASVNRLLKAAALRAFPSEQVAALHGETWLSFLRQRCAGLPGEVDAPVFLELALVLEHIAHDLVHEPECPRIAHARVRRHDRRREGKMPHERSFPRLG